MIGSARVSNDVQSLDLQLGALRAARCERILTDKVSTTKARHPGLAAAVFHLRRGDVLVIGKWYRLSRTVKGLIDPVAVPREGKLPLRSLAHGIDTTVPVERMVFHIMSSLARMERKRLAARASRSGHSMAARPGRRTPAGNDARESGIGPGAAEGRNVPR